MNRMNKKYGTVLIGATFYAAAYASVSPCECLIVERHSFVGSDFAQSVKQCVLKDNGYSGLASEFRTELVKRAVIDEDGNAQMVPMADILSEFIVKNDLCILLETETVSVVQMEDGTFTVGLFDRDGFSYVLADKVIDTEEYKTEDAYRTLGLTVLSNGKVPDLSQGEEGTFFKTVLPNVYIYHMRLSDKDDAVSAHLKMKRLIEQTDTFCGMRAVAVANCFAYHYPSPVRIEKDGETAHIPSASFPDPLSSMEGGASDALSYFEKR